MPHFLAFRYAKPNLEDVFLELCLRDGVMETAKVREERQSRKSKFPIVRLKKDKNSNNGVVNNGDINQEEKEEAPKKKKRTKTSRKKLSDYFRKQKDDRMKWPKVTACMLKTFNRMKKRIGFLIYQFALPALQVSLFCLAIGQDPRDLPVAVVNLENSGAPCDVIAPNLECPVTLGAFNLPSPNEHLHNFTCRYLSFLDNNVARPVYFDNLEEATLAVRHGEAWGVVAMDGNFSSNLYSRIIESEGATFEGVDKDLLEASSIKVRMDITNQHVAFTLQMKFVEAFEAFVKQLVSSCGLPEELTQIPLVFEAPIFGTHDLTFTDFMAPGIILTIVHSMALGYSAIIIIMERNEGLLDRTWVAGVAPGEFALAHFLVSLVVNLIQVVVTLIFMIFVFQVPNEGSFFLVFLLTMLQGVCGTTIGLIISAVCETQQDATQIALGIFYPNLILSGIIWPVESMPEVLRYVAYVLPQTFACQAMRGILLRGWDLTYMPVYRGFLVTIAWIGVTYVVFKSIVMRRQ